MSINLILITAILVVNLVLVIFVMIKISGKSNIQADLERLERGQKEDTGRLRQELNASLLGFNEAIRKSVESQLDKVRSTVDEKLQTTLENKIGASFAQVSERLEKVHQGLGEMHNLVMGVGDLKRVLTNVKTRGVWGEVQLGALLEQMLSPDQYQKNAKIKDGTVEYAVCLPDGLIPIDAKFPYEDYERLIAASEKADAAGVENAAAELAKRIRTEAQRIEKKYIDVPKTTDFAIMFLPTEGLYAEVMRQPGLSSEIQKKHKVTITGPSTLGAFLTSLQMGFRTLAIQKRSGEVWQALGEAKKEFGKYADWVDKVKKGIDAASKTLDEAGTRTRAIERSLRDVSEDVSIENNPVAQIENASKN